MAGQMALILHQRPSALLGLDGSGIEAFLLDALVLAEVLKKAVGESPLRPVRSTKELVRRKRAGWKPPRGQPIWV